MGPFFFSKVLNLPEKPILRPAELIGYPLKLWGQYPALVDGPAGAVVEGMGCEIESERHAEKLVRYETRAYRPAPCPIRFTDRQEPGEVSGTTFEFVGNTMDVDNGKFDFVVWLPRIGRTVKAEGEVALLSIRC